MRKYYLFCIKGKNYQNLKKTYSVLEELFYLNSNKYNYGITIFKELCVPFNKEKILNLLKRKFSNQNNQIIINDLEETRIEIDNVCIVIETSKNVPIIFKYLNELEKNILVCDFFNRDYFWLNDFVCLNLKVTI